MKANGMRAWRRAARRWRRKQNRRSGAPCVDGPGRWYRRQRAWFKVRPTIRHNSFTPRSLVGMSQAHRKWLAMCKSIGQRTDYRVECGLYRVGERLRPCPGCPACDEPRSSVRQLRGWVRLAGLRLFAWKRIATEPCNGFTGRWSAGWTVHLRTGERIGGAWRDDDLRAVWETAAQHCLNGMRKALGSAPRCDGSGVIPARSQVNQGKPLAVEPADDLG